MSERERSIVLVDDDPIVRSWVRSSLEGSEFRIAGEAGSAQEAIDLVERRRPDAVLLDYRLKDSLGTGVLHDLRARGIRCTAVLMSSHDEPGFNESAREAGARGTVLKTGRPLELIEALRRATAGVEWFDARYPRRPPGRAALSPRERAVLRLVAHGATNREVAAELDVTAETVKTLLTRSYAKLGARRRAEAVAVASELGLL